MIIGASSLAGSVYQLKHEVDSIELYIPKMGLYNGSKLQDDEFKKVYDELSTSNAFTSMHAPYFADVDTYPDDLLVDTTIMDDKQFGLMEESIKLANKLDTRVVVIHPGKIHQDRYRSFSKMVDNLKSLASTASDYGVMLGLENKEGTDTNNLCCDADELLQAVEEVNSDYLGVTFDIGHANLTCGGDNQKLRYFANRISKYVVHMHLHDNYGLWTKDYDGDLHQAPGKCTIDFSILEDIKGYRGIYNLEVFSIDDVVAGKKIINNLRV
ncbi:sugar phosphate isomerase/epimerase family protein [Methanohalobium sp.]|uniref:sugar phosphate isomerase/epimerase family protein n=1 Tax=Methanohalobium sp. TaxID=2837493 RepID=UPI0025F316FB|nr:sugar phosphate isomerase/epimerase family protein [Methanohalobium sp.]